MLQIKLITVLFLVTLSQLSNADRMLNDMQSCQALLQYIEQEVERSDDYSGAKQEGVIKGLKGYNQFLQNEVITPGLIKFYQGDKSKAAETQLQVNDYKNNLVAQLQKRFKSQGIVMDNLVELNNCTKKIVPKGQALNDLKKSFSLIQSTIRQ